MNKMVVKKLNRKEIKEKINQGYVRIIVLYEMIGHPKEHIEKTMKIFLENIDNDEDIITIKKDVEETIPIEGNLYSTAAECEYLIYGIEKIIWLATNFLPANIEIKEPKELTFKDKDFSDWINDLLSKLHEINTKYNALKNENQGLIKNMNALIRNNILLVMGTEELTAKEIGRRTGMKEEHIIPFLEALIKEKKIIHHNKKFKRIK